MAITLAMLKTFVSVAENGSLMEAAKQLGRTPSAVSMALKQLEIEFDTQLFSGERKGNLTPTGIFALEQARNLTDQCDEVFSAIRAYAKNEIGYISLACVPSVAEHILPQVIKAFHAQWPKVEIEIRDADSRSVINAVHSGRVQFGVASLAKKLPGIEFTPLFQDSLGLVSSADDAPPKPSKNISNKKLALFLKDKKLLLNSITQSITLPEILENQENSRITVHNVTSVLALVKAGAGVTVLPRLLVPETDTSLNFIPFADEKLRRTVGLFQRNGSLLSPAALSLVEKIHTRISEIEHNIGGNFTKLNLSGSA
ncbi:hypothetical protein WH96_15775 [Kiloniella spongiae]|uniref:HTH lysR-type domain-containing protein n=1 Tax=Kiloniella spongiae TaxID=1489064 RepID=A0A0H2MBA1_9PROT|nr:LysR substrate-binding domain-containing protein [Kiloniella spongiae]KLN59839.1 hypothetical protein WH96_15775 [Kiloniella spongiae]